MYRRSQNQMILPEDFFLPFGGKLDEENRWVKLVTLVPWHKVEDEYSQQFEDSMTGQQAVSVRVALGSLIIQQRLGLSDRETVQQITENPYLQYFIGLLGFQSKKPFHPSLMVHFRKRLGEDAVNKVNEWIVMEACDMDGDDEDVSGDDDSSGSNSSEHVEQSSAADTSTAGENKGKLLLDATCTPADIAFPTDLSLLNTAREKLEDMVDILHAPQCGSVQKPRTYRQKARKQYLAVTKQRRVNYRVLRKAIGQQLRYVARDLRIVGELNEEHGLMALSRQQYTQLLVIQELYRQQREMYSKRSHRVDDRIVSISQPHVRPIVRGKAKANVEFGAKVAISLVNGYALVERLEWDTYNEGNTLQASVEAYYQRYGCYPEAVLADKIYRNRENLRYCKENGIRLSGPQLGRPSKVEQAGQRRVARADSAERNAVEGKFGEGKRTYGLGLIRTHLRNTSETVIALQLLVMNLERRLRILFCAIWAWLLASGDSLTVQERPAYA
jgi:transposase, IS5 family